MSQLTAGIRLALSGDTRDCFHYSENWYTNQDVLRDVAVVRNWMHHLGVERGHRVLLGYPNSYAFAVAYLAILQHGAVVVPFNPDFKSSELEMFLARTRAQIGFFDVNLERLLRGQETTLQTAFVTDDLGVGVPSAVWCIEDGEWKLQEERPPEQHTGAVMERSEALEIPLAGESQLPESPTGQLQSGQLPTDEMTASALAVGAPLPNISPSEDDPAVLMYTSGTTGCPKAVSLLHRHLFAASSQIIDAHQLTRTDVSYCFLPLFHINAQVIAVLSTILSGGKTVISPRFSASRFWQTVSDYGVTWVSAVPTVIAILQNSDGPDTPPTHLRFIRSASAQLPQLVARRFERRFGIPVIQSYGMTEAASQICVNPLPPGERRDDSVGLPFGVELKIVNQDGTEVPIGTVGEVVLRGPSVIQAYEEADNQDDFQDGWFHTGDMGRVDSDGYVYLTGRKKELINRAGEKVSPYEVEDVIREHPEVLQVAVIGLPHPLYGERVAAYVVARSSGNLDWLTAEILSMCQESLSKYKCPSSIEFVSEIPVGPTGKIQRTQLKQQVLAAMIS